MLDLALKNMNRRRTRTILTTLGIVIGIAAIVALGSFSEGINAMINKELGALAGKVIVIQKGASITSGYSGSDITREQIGMIADLPGVSDAVPMLFYMPPFGFGSGAPQWALIGIEADKIDILIGKSIEMSYGRRPDEGEREVAIAGSSAAESLDLRVGDFWEFEDKSFEVIGIIEETGISDVDMGIIVPIEDLQDALKTDNYQVVYAVLDDPSKAEDFANEVEDSDDTLEALTSTDMARQVSTIAGQVSIFTLGIGAIAAFVGGLGVLNTMIMAVMERKREIGVMKAIGATRRFVLLQIISESSMISVVGGAIGLFLGWLASFGLGFITRGFITATVTPGLAIGSMLFAFTLGFIGGLYPAWKAASMDPVEALRG